ncbi:MAG: histidinol-phosphate transaminase [Vicingus serpentipes]|nr:histidinol-phosphate transaminase [Vicingus serpentipes]
MFNLKNIVRKNILELKPYSSARDEYTGDASIFLDANENPYGELNRYPDPQQKELKQLLGKVKNIAPEKIFIGNGSDEVIDLAYRIFCNPGEDKAITFSPTYGMYDVSAAINNIELIKIPLTTNFQIDLPSTMEYLKDNKVKLIFICSPNNPTGNSIDNEATQFILKNFDGIVIIDEAYIDFSPQKSWISEIENYPNLIVSQTFSKAWGLAAARVGIAFMNNDILQLYNKVKPPYNVSELNQQAAINALSDVENFEKNKQILLTEKEKLKTALLEIEQVVKVYPSDANFLLVEVTNANQLYADLVNQKIITRNRNSVINNCIRITVGTPEENKNLITSLR